MIFLGTAGSIPAGILARAGETFRAVPGAPLRRAGPIGIGRAAVETARGFRAAQRALRAHDAQLALGFGGFASGGVLLGARALGLATAIHEANVDVGLANRLLSRVVHRVFLTHATTPLRGGVTVGMPVRGAITALRGRPRQPPSGRMRVLVVSGSRGSAPLAGRLIDVLVDLARGGVEVEVLLQAGSDSAALADRYRRAGIAARAEADLDVAAAYVWADVAIARAGASTIAELALAALPACLVPLGDASARHQDANARTWTAAGAGLAMADDAWDAAALTAWLRSMAGVAAWSQASRATASLADPDAASRLVTGCLELMQDLSR